MDPCRPPCRRATANAEAPRPKMRPSPCNSAAQVDSKLSPEFEKISKTSRPHFFLFLNGEQIELVEGVNAPQLEKLINDNLPEGLLDLDDAGGDGGDDDDD